MADVAARTAAPPRVRAYREFLTPLFHRRFVNAAFLSLAICYADALVLGWQTSSWVFSEIHIYSAPFEADLGWVANGELYERLRLNEKVVYLRSHAFIVASVQAFFHLRHDYSYISLPVRGVGEVNTDLVNENAHTRARLEKVLPEVYKKALRRAFASAVFGPFMYFPIRSWAWSWSLSVARLVWNIPDDAEPDIIPPFHWSVLLRTMLQAFLLYGLWESCNTLFSVLVAQRPIKKDKPLSDGSKDPNGSLINGLQSKKSAVRSFALWELDLIVRHFEERRKSILTEIDRTGESAWSQVLQACMETVNGVSARIAGPAAVKVQPIPPQSLESLPKIAPPLKPGPVAEAYDPKYVSDRLTSFIDYQARRAGSASPGDQLDLSPHLKKIASNARDSLLTKEQQQFLNKEHVEASAHTLLSRLLRLRIPTTFFLETFQPGVFFQETYSRRLSSTLFGNTFNDKNNIIRAIDVLTMLLVASVTEDTYGVVSKNVPEIWRAFVKTVDGIEALLKSDRTHWTDVDFAPNKKLDEDARELLLHLKTALRRLVDTFSGEAAARGLTPADVQHGRRAAAPPAA